MSNKNLDQSISLEVGKEMINENETKVVGDDWMKRASISTEETSTEIKEEDNIEIEMFDSKTPQITESEEPSEYDGPGLIVTDDEYTEDARPNQITTGLSKESLDNINQYIDMMDDQIEDLKENGEEMKAEILKERNMEIKNDAEETNDEDEDDNIDTEDEFNEKYDKAVVVIDKTNFGTVINFTEEEHAKLEKSRKIKLTEVENVDLQTIKVKKMKRKDDLNKIINKVTNINTTNVVLPASGYTAEIKGCSAYEIISLADDSKNALLDAQNKWSLLYNKIANTSLGKMSFDDFLKNTSTADYDVLVYGLLCSTYPDDDKLPITCAKCNNQFEHQYSTKSLIRAEMMTEPLKNTIMNIVDNSVEENSATEIHKNSRLFDLRRIKLPVSGIIAEIYMPSAYDVINRSIKDLQENKDTKYKDASVLSSFVRTFYILDEEDDSYYEVTNALDITKAIYSLSDIDIRIIENLSSKLMEDISIDYGIMNIKCPKCRHYTATIPVEPENVLFYRYRQTASTELE